MTDQQYLRYRESAEADYADNIAKAGVMPLPEAREKAREDYRQLLPDGLASAGHHLWTAYDSDDEVGMVWLHIDEKSDGTHAFGYDFEVRPELRRKGYGRMIMQAVEQLCRERGVGSIGLSVFGNNLGARALYEEMGFEVTRIQMRKLL
ncbi:GNAT family N-acetyltransferase [Micromonospora mirobrigensis]|uniref:Acetyltransferase (GNAT) family protein n=1 Tax=Micromonospora mirobrigensis TaxID=262898 RepID=A0A1C4ZMV6_9ACTN|nr:GNAT family N-acetyltransferase [Micromonospora mirobrigensis]SCF34262.1 Acetyltransferase (GNAT) family protein [Micromonospora mirobrigensis]